MEKTTWKTKGKIRQRKKAKKNTHVKAYYLTHELKKSRRMMVKMHSQSKQTTTKHIQMRACILSHNLLASRYLNESRAQHSHTSFVQNVNALNRS